MPRKSAPSGDMKSMFEAHVAGGWLAALSAIRRVLPQYIDDVQRDIGYETYRSMLNDPAVAAAMDTLKLGVATDHWSVEPAFELSPTTKIVDPADVQRAERCKELAEFVHDTLEGTQTDFLDLTGEMLEALAYGHRVAEIILKPGIGRWAGKYVLDDVRPRDNKAVAFVVDEFGVVEGFAYTKPNGMSSVNQAIIGATPEMTLPRAKFLLFIHAPRSGDPRGRSILRPAYNSWFMKTQVLPDFYKYLRQFASPSIVGKTAPELGEWVAATNEDGTPKLDSNNDPVMVSAERALLVALLGFLNATALAVPAGTEIDFVQSEGDGAAFINGQNYFDRQITTAILGTSQLTMEAQHESRSSKQTAQDVASARIARQRKRLERAIKRDVVNLLVRLNWGDEALIDAPTVCLTKTDDHDFVAELDAVSRAYGAGFIHDSQLPELDARLGLPERDMEAIAEERAEAAANAALVRGMVDTSLRPGDDEDDDQIGRNTRTSNAASP